MTTDTGRPVSAGSRAPRLVHGEAAERFRAELRAYAAVRTEWLLVAVGRGLGEASVRLDDIAEGRSPGFARFALCTGRNVVRGRGPLRSVLLACATWAKDHLTGAREDPGKEEDKDSDDQDDDEYDNDNEYDNENDDRNACDDAYAEDGSRR